MINSGQLPLFMHDVSRC